MRTSRFLLKLSPLGEASQESRGEPQLEIVTREGIDSSGNWQGTHMDGTDFVKLADFFVVVK